MCISSRSDGWDRTAQMVAGTELMLDPFYRTLKGFEILIEKEWCSFGHQFRRRFGQDNGNADDEQRSPVFILWLECIYQIMQQYPTAFEFNETLLLAINDHVYSGKFGTFLFDCEAKRFDFHAKDRTLSLWSFINDPVRVNDFINPNYIRERNRSASMPPRSICVCGRTCGLATTQRISPRRTFPIIINEGCIDCLLDYHSQCVGFPQFLHTATLIRSANQMAEHVPLNER